MTLTIRLVRLIVAAIVAVVIGLSVSIWITAWIGAPVTCFLLIYGGRIAWSGSDSQDPAKAR